MCRHLFKILSVAVQPDFSKSHISFYSAWICVNKCVPNVFALVNEIIWGETNRRILYEFFHKGWQFPTVTSKGWEKYFALFLNFLQVFYVTFHHTSLSTVKLKLRLLYLSSHMLEKKYTNPCFLCDFRIWSFLFPFFVCINIALHFDRWYHNKFYTVLIYAWRKIYVHFWETYRVTFFMYLWHTQMSLVLFTALQQRKIDLQISFLLLPFFAPSMETGMNFPKLFDLL